MELEEKVFCVLEGNVWRILEIWKDLYIVGAIGYLLKTFESSLIHSYMI